MLALQYFTPADAVIELMTHIIWPRVVATTVDPTHHW